MNLLTCKTFLTSIMLLLSVIALGGCSSHRSHKWGYIDRTGNWVIAPQFDEPPGQFCSGVAAVPVQGGWEFIDRQGRIVESLPKSDIQPSDFSEGLALCERRIIYSVDEKLTSRDFKYFYVDRSGRKIICPDIVGGGKFSEGLAPVQFAPKPPENYAFHGYVDKKGKPAIQGKFIDASDFHEGLAAVQIKSTKPDSFGSLIAEKWGYIDKTGKWVIQPTFPKAGQFSKDGLAPIGYGYVNRNGETVLVNRYSTMKQFSEGAAVVSLQSSPEKYGFINTKGEIIAQPQWDWTDSFSEGLAGVGTNTGKYEDDVSMIGEIMDCGFVNREFKLVIPQKFGAVRPFSEGLAAAYSK